MVKNLPASARDTEDVGSIPGSGRSPGEQHTPVFLPGESHGHRSLASYSPLDHRESAMTKATWHTPTLAGRFFTIEPLGKPLFIFKILFIYLAASGLSCGMWDL